MSNLKIVKVKEDDDGMRLDRWFKNYYPEMPISMLNKLCRKKQVKVDGKKVEAKTKLESGQEVRFSLSNMSYEERPKVNKVKALSDKDIEFIQDLVIFKDKNIIAINKPSGIAVQGGTNTNRHIDGMLDGLKFENIDRPRLVHRIDKDTSGILLLARNRKYAEILTKAFKDHDLQKTYLAICYNVPEQMEGVFSAPLAKLNIKGNEKMMVDYDEGKKAVTELKVLDKIGGKCSLLELQLMTGRTHQLRVHCLEMKCPIIGDGKYKLNDNIINISDIDNKLHLHAWKVDLSFVYKQKMIIEAPLPEHMKKSIDYLGLDF